MEWMRRSSMVWENRPRSGSDENGFISAWHVSPRWTRKYTIPNREGHRWTWKRVVMDALICECVHKLLPFSSQTDKKKVKGWSEWWRKRLPPFLFVFQTLQLFHFRTNKIVHQDRNGRFACNFFRFDAMISPLAKVMGPQSRQKRGSKNASTSRTWF